MIVIKHNYPLNEIVTALQQANPSRKQTHQASIKLWAKYEQLITEGIHKAILFASKDMIEKNTLCLSWNEIHNKLGKCRSFDYLPWLHQHYPLVKILHKGNNISGLLTMVEPIFEIEIAATSQTNREAFETMYKAYYDELLRWEDNGYSNDIVDWVPIDIRSLRAFIQANIKSTETATRACHIDTLKRNLVWAQTILSCAEYFMSQGTEPGIPQIVNESEYGRRYYRGLNLQNAPKVVRHAALGHCYQYDLHASVFAWRLTEAKRINSQLKLPYTTEYLDEKDNRREQLAEALDLKISFKSKLEIIKQLLTAVGFGSRASNSGVSWTDSGGTRHYPSINEIIRSPEARKNLLLYPWLSGFIEEQKLISKTIFDHYKDGMKDVEVINNDRGTISPNRCLAYLYQHAERKYIDLLTQEAKEAGSLLLVVHDGFYTSKPLKLLGMKEQLYKINPEADVTREEHQAWAYNEYEEEHRRLILEQEKIANDGFIPSNILANYARIDYMSEHKVEYSGADEFDNATRLIPEYDPELDPFYEEF